MTQHADTGIVFGAPLDEIWTAGHYQPLLVGVVLQALPTREIFDEVRQAVIRWATQLPDDTHFYLYRPEEFDITERVGAFVAQVANYSPPVEFKLHMAMEDTVNVLGYEGCEFRKLLLYVTDQFGAENFGDCRKAIELNESHRYECEFFFVGMGKKYHPLFQTLSPNFRHVNHPRGLGDVLIEFVR